MREQLPLRDIDDEHLYGGREERREYVGVTGIVDN
jgi:hypothetical protein